MIKTIRVSLLALCLAVVTVNTTNAAFPKDKETSTVVATAVTTTSSNEELTAAVAELKNETTTVKQTTSNKYAGGSKSKIVAALLAFFLGNLGIHSFYMGNKKKGLIQLGLTVLGGILLIVGIASAVSTVTNGVTVPATGFGTLGLIGVLLITGVGIWALVDLVRILTGGLAPEEGFDD
jgi:TM2 domain-containing membrane protein YozV